MPIPANKNSTGRLIVFEGGEGAGKTTQVRLLSEWLTSLDIPNITTREPGGTSGAEEIRQLLISGEANRWSELTEALLHHAARRDHVERLIEPAILAGTWVICDRYEASTIAYQCYGQGLARELAKQLQALMANRWPDLTIVMDINPETSQQRLGERGAKKDRYESLGADFHARVRKGYLEIALSAFRPSPVIDATQSLDAVTTAVRKIVNNILILPTFGEL